MTRLGIMGPLPQFSAGGSGPDSEDTKYRYYVSSSSSLRSHSPGVTDTAPKERSRRSHSTREYHGTPVFPSFQTNHGPFGHRHDDRGGRASGRGGRRCQGRAGRGKGSRGGADGRTVTAAEGARVSEIGTGPKSQGPPGRCGGISRRGNHHRGLDTNR